MRTCIYVQMLCFLRLTFDLFITVSGLLRLQGSSSRSLSYIDHVVMLFDKDLRSIRLMLSRVIDPLESLNCFEQTQCYGKVVKYFALLRQ